MRLPERPGETLLGGRGSYEMNVILHQAIARNTQGIFLGILLKHAEVDSTVLVIVKYRLMVRPALGDVMRIVRHDGPPNARHDRT